MSSRDPFSVFGLPRSLDVDRQQLERRHVQLSQQVHPDRLHNDQRGDCAAVLARAAEINDAYRLLRSPWDRARVLIGLLQPDALEVHKKLDQQFLIAALEDAEAVAHADAATAPALAARLERELDQRFDELRTALARGDARAAALLFHKASYHRKALADLEPKL